MSAALEEDQWSNGTHCEFLLPLHGGLLFTEEEQEWRPVIELGTTLEDASAWSIRSMPILIYQGNTYSPHGSLGRSMRRSAKYSLWRGVN